LGFICPSFNSDIQFISQDEIENGSKGYTNSLGAVAWASFGNSTSFSPPEKIRVTLLVAFRYV
jgi:hypothetical protein